MIGNQAIVACLVVALTSSAACTSMRPIGRIEGATPPASFGRIEPGDEVSVVMKDGRRHRFHVTRMDKDTLVSDSGGRYARADMVALEHKDVERRKVLGVFAAIAAGTSMLIDYLDSATRQ